MRLLLFDIDGTLLRVNGEGETAIQRAVATVTGQSVSTEHVSFSGRTDPAILRDVLSTNGLPVRKDLLTEVTRAYIDAARENIHASIVDRLPGTAALLSLLADREEVFLGLVTGNVEPIAFHKLQTVGLADHFPVGAFGSDHEARSQLPPLAVERATSSARHPFSIENSVVIGDTLNDINCAREAGARSVAVSTGRPSHSELAEHAPDLLLRSLAPPTTTVRQLLAL